MATKYSKYSHKSHLKYTQILVDLIDLADNMPKIKRSNSEPYSLHYSHIHLEDTYGNSPHTPIHNGSDDQIFHSEM